MKTLFPVKNGIITQPYGAGAEFYQQRFGIAFHNAIDVVSFHGDSLLACKDLRIFKVYDANHGSVSKGFGLHGLTDPDENGICEEWSYWHAMSNIQAWPEQKVKQGEVVAYEGDSGAVFVSGIAVPDDQKGRPPYPGTHVHWGKRLVQRVKTLTGPVLNNVNKEAYIDPDGYYYQVLNYNNGVEGFIDPLKDDIIYYKEWNLTQQVNILQRLISLWQQLLGKK